MIVIDYLFDKENCSVAIIQIFGYIALIYFGIKSITIFRIGLSKEHKEQGSLPVLAFVYFIFSVIFIFNFIRSFECIYFYNKIALLESSNFFDDINTIAPIFNISILALLITFTLNFSKSFFTLNCLEFGILTDCEYGEKLYAGKSKSILIIDTVIKTIIAFSFVSLEHTLSQSHSLFKLEHLRAFVEIGWLAICLYSFTIVWFFYNIHIDNKNSDKSLNNSWRWLSGIQFFAGLFIAGALLLTGYVSNTDEYRIWGLVLSSAVLIFSIVVVGTIFWNEITQKKIECS